MLENYRPISLISNISKIFEKCIKSKITEFYEQTGFFSSGQYGFRKGLNTEDALLSQINQIVNSLEKKHKVAGLYLDIKKAFDTVDHSLLIIKLSNSGIKGNLLRWFENYLNNRSQRTKVGQATSTKLKVTSGVPQGSTLGPLLFLVYANDLHDLGLFGKVYTFADDTALIYNAISKNVLINNINHDLKILTQWFNLNKICPNIQKTQILCFYLNKDFDLKDELILHKNINCYSGCKHNCTPLTQVDEIKYLGVTLDSGLAWGPHIAKLSSKLGKLSRIFYLLQNSFSKQHRRKIYLALYEPIIRYALKIWGGAANYHLEKIKVLQRKTIRYIGDYGCDERTYKKFLSLKILPLMSLYLCACATYLSKNSKQFISKNPNTKTRNADKTFFIANNWVKERSRNQFGYIGPSRINKLPESIKIKIATCKKWKLKKDLKEFLFENVASGAPDYY